MANRRWKLASSGLRAIHEAALKTLTRHMEERPPGWIGPVPYVVVLQWLICIAIPLRFWAQRAVYSLPRILIPSMAMVGITLCTSLLAIFERKGWRKPHLHDPLLAAAVLVISRIYFLTDNIRSDVFLLYFLPFIYAAEYFRAYGTVAIFFATSASFAYVLSAMSAGDTRGVVIVFVAREVFFFAILALGSLLIAIGRLERETRLNTIDSLLHFKEDVDQLIDLPKIIERTTAAAERLLSAGSPTNISAVMSLNGVCFPSRLLRLPSVDLVNLIKRRCMESGKPLLLSALGKSGTRVFNTEYGGFRSLVAAPIRANNTVSHCVFVASEKQNGLLADDLKVLENLAALAGTAIDRAAAIEAFRELSLKTSTAPVERDRILNSMLDRLELCGFETIGISVVDPYRNTIEMIRGRNVPFGWMKRSKHDLESSDIIPSIVRGGVPEIIEGPDPRFNPDIYERFDHQRLVRAFVPVKSERGTIAVIQAGCDRSHREKVFTAANLQALTNLCQENVELIANTRPFVLFEEIASRACGLVAAQSASIHVYRDGEVLLQAGAGKASHALVRRFVRRRASADLAENASSGDVEVLDNPDDVRKDYSSLYEAGVRSLLKIPLALDGQRHGVLCVHFWDRVHKLSEREIELERAFAGLMEIALQNSLLVEAAADLADRATVMARFQIVIEALASSPDPAKMLGDLAQHLLFMFDAEAITLYEFIEAEKRFKTPPVMKGYFHYPDEMRKQIERTSVLWEIVTSGARNRFEENVSKVSLLWDEVDGYSRFARRENIQSCAIITLRAPDTEEIVGVLFVNYRERHVFREDEKQAIRALGASAAIAIRSTRLQHEARGELARRSGELRAFQTVDHAIAGAGSKPVLNDLLQIILEQAMYLTEAPVGMILWRDTNSTLQPVVIIGALSEADVSNWSHEDGIVGMAARNRETQLVPDVCAEPWARIYRPVVAGTRCELAVPIIDENELLGVLNLEHFAVGGLTHDDRVVVQTLVVQAVIAAHYTRLYDDVNRQDRPLRALRVLVDRIHDKRNDSDCILRLALTGITAGQGLAFSRAMIFLADEHRRGLVGQMAVGALDMEEAMTTWSDISSLEKVLQSQNLDIFAELLSRAERSNAAIRGGEEPESRLTAAIRQVCIDASVLDGGLADAFHNARSRVVRDRDPDLARDLFQQFNPAVPLKSTFVCVPIKGTAGTIGVLVADLEFLVPQRSIHSIDVRFLEAFAEIVGTGLENAKMQSELSDEDKQASWNETISDIYHELGTGIHVVEGRLDLLRRRVVAADPASGASFETLRRSVGELNDALSDIRTYGRPDAYRFVLCDLGALVRSAISDALTAFFCDVRPDLPPFPVFMLADQRRLKNVLVELFKNSHEAAKAVNKTVTITVRLGKGVTESSPAELLRVDVIDNGPGIPRRIKKRIFERQFSTKATADRGRGLAIVRDVIRMHGGSVSEIGEPELGAHFVLYFPIVNSEHLIPGEKNADHADRG